MTTRRNNSAANLADLEGASNPIDVPGITPPPGVEANVETRVRYTRMVDPEQSNYSDDLRGLAAEEIDENNLPEPSPQDPYSEFLYTWQRYTGYPLKIVRMADPATRRMPGQTYNRPCFEMEILSDMPFDPNNLTGMLQTINSNSGGVFRLWLTDESGQPIPGARLDRLVVADPPKQYNTQPNPRDFNPHGYNPFDEDPRYYQREREREPASTPAKSETELWLENAQRELFQKVMMRALDPPPPPTPDPLSSLSPDDRLALGLLQRGDILESAVNRIASLAQAPDRIESSTYKDKLADAAIQLVTHNPQIVATATDIISRMVTAVAIAFAPRGNNSQIVAEPMPVHAPPAQRAAPQIPPRYPIRHADEDPYASQQAVNTGLPEAPQPDDMDDLEQDEIDMMEEITKLLLSDKPLSFSDPAVVEIRETYPEMFDKAMQGIAAMPSMVIVQYLCGKSQFCADVFTSPRNGPHMKARLEELKTLIKTSGLLPPEVKQAIEQTENQNETAPTSE